MKARFVRESTARAAQTARAVSFFWGRRKASRKGAKTPRGSRVKGQRRVPGGPAISRLRELTLSVPLCGFAPLREAFLLCSALCERSSERSARNTPSQPPYETAVGADVIRLSQE